MAFEDVRIRDLSRVTQEWTPPLSALGGPPAHELYADLVVHAGLQLFRDAQTRPWVVLRDGAQRRAFRVPSPGLRSALDRFRMRRNLRPVPDRDIDEFVRIVEARATDPDIAIPRLESPVEDAVVSDRLPGPRLPGADPAVSRWRASMYGPEPAFPSAFGPTPPDSAPGEAAGSDAVEGGSGSPRSEPPPVRAAFSQSGARAFPPPEPGVVARYVRVFRELVREGDWMGTTHELCELTHEDPFSMFDSLLRYRDELVRHDILVTNVEVGGDFRWLAVDRTKVRGSERADGPVTTEVFPPSP